MNLLINITILLSYGILYAYGRNDISSDIADDKNKELDDIFYDSNPNNSIEKFNRIIRKTKERLSDEIVMVNLPPIKKHPTAYIPFLCNGYLCQGIIDTHVGIVNYQGAWTDRIIYPGSYYYDPWGTVKIVPIKLMDEDIVTNVQCIDMKGTTFKFPEIKVRNQIADTDVLDTVRKYGIDFDKIHIYQRVESEMLDICSHLTAQEIMFTLYDKINEMLLNALQVEQKRLNTHILIHSVIIAKKPIAPENVQENYKRLAAAQSEAKVFEAEKAKVQVEMERNLIEAHGNSLILQEKAIAEKNKRMLEHQTELQISFEKVEAKKKESFIEFEIKLKSAETDAESNRMIYESLKDTWDNQGWRGVEMAKALAPTTKIYGEKIPSVLMPDNFFSK